MQRGAISCRIARTRSFTASTSSAATSRSRSAPADCARSGSGRGTARSTLCRLDAAGVSRMSLGDNEEFDSDWVRYVETSPRDAADDLRLRRPQPASERMLKRRAGARRFRSGSSYATEYLRAPARDGARVPVAIVYRRGHAARRHGAAAAVRVRRVRAFVGSRVSVVVDLAARSRVRLRDRADPRRPGAGPRLVRRRQAAERRGTRSPTSSTSPSYLVAQRLCATRAACSRAAAAPAAC